MGKAGTFNWAEPTMMVFGWLLDLNPKIWMLSNSNSKVINLASVHNELRGTYVV